MSCEHEGGSSGWVAWEGSSWSVRRAASRAFAFTASCTVSTTALPTGPLEWPEELLGLGAYRAAAEVSSFISRLFSLTFLPLNASSTETHVQWGLTYSEAWLSIRGRLS